MLYVPAKYAHRLWKTAFQTIHPIAVPWLACCWAGAALRPSLSMDQVLNILDETGRNLRRKMILRLDLGLRPPPHFRLHPPLPTTKHGKNTQSMQTTLPNIRVQSGHHHRNLPKDQQGTGTSNRWSIRTRRVYGHPKQVGSLFHTDANTAAASRSATVFGVSDGLNNMVSNWFCGECG